jgi:hypothetical protein
MMKDGFKVIMNYCKRNVRAGLADGTVAVVAVMV